jgi:hypothetical protein
MEFIQNINAGSLLDTLASLTAAFVLGGLIGLERQYRQRTAGLRTNVLPHAIEVASIHSGTITGKLNGVMPAMTPTGWRIE